MKWCVKFYYGKSSSGIAILPPHNTRSKVWYDDINAANAHREAHHSMHLIGYTFKVEEYYD